MNKLREQWNYMMQGEWPEYRTSLYRYKLVPKGIHLPEDFNDILNLSEEAKHRRLTHNERVAQSAPDEMYSLFKLSAIKTKTDKRNWTAVYGAPLSETGYDASVLEDGVMKKVEIKHHFYTISYFQETRKHKQRVVFLEENKYGLMLQAGTDYVVHLFAIDGHPDIVDWAYWDAKDYVRTDTSSERDEYSVISDGGKSSRPETGYWLTDAIDVGGQFNGREV